MVNRYGNGPEPLLCSQGGVPYNKAHLDAKDAKIKRLEDEVEEAGKAALRQVRANRELQSKLRSCQKQLPAEMQGCTIRFFACEVGHGRLIADNWIDSGCPWCRLAALVAAEKRVSELAESRDELAEAYAELKEQRNQLSTRLGAIEGQLRDAKSKAIDFMIERDLAQSKLGATHEALEWLGDGNIDDVLEMMDYARNAANACADGGHSSTADEQVHPEDDCDACGGRNITWSAPSTIWNAVMGSPNGIVCPQCFDRRAAARGFVGLWRFEAGREPVDSAGEAPTNPNDISSGLVDGSTPEVASQSRLKRLAVQRGARDGEELAAPDKRCGSICGIHQCELRPNHDGKHTRCGVEWGSAGEGQKCGACYALAEPGSEYCKDHQPEPYHPGGECIIGEAQEPKA